MIPQQHEFTVLGEGIAEGNGAKYRGDLEWKVFYDPDALPGFMPGDKAKDFTAGIVGVSSKSASIYNHGTMYIAGGRYLR